MPRINKLSSLGLLPVCLYAAASCSTFDAPAGSVLASGTYGGTDAGLIVADTAFHLHVGCTYGDYSGKAALDRDGNFSVAGSYMLRAYPIVVGPSVPAQFTGHVSGASVTITAVVNDTVQHTIVTKGPVVVTLGTNPQMGPCPICRDPYGSARAAGALPEPILVQVRKLSQ